MKIHHPIFQPAKLKEVLKLPRLKALCAQQQSVISSWAEALQQFLNFKRAQGRSERTLYDYDQHISRFFSDYPDAWNAEKLKPHLLEYLSQPVMPGTYNLRLVYLRHFFDWCIMEGFLQANPTDGLTRRKEEARIVNVPIKTLQKLLLLQDKNTFAGLRDHVLITLTLDTGIRPKECLSLLPSDANLSVQEIYVRAHNAKTRVARTLPITQKTAKGLRKLLKVRPVEWSDMELPIFCGWEGKHFKTESWSQRMSDYSKKLGTKVRPYDLRHCFALNFLRNGGNVFVLQRFMGHSNLKMTRRYLVLTQEDILPRPTWQTCCNPNGQKEQDTFEPSKSPEILLQCFNHGPLNHKKQNINTPYKCQ